MVSVRLVSDHVSERTLPAGAFIVCLLMLLSAASMAVGGGAGDEDTADGSTGDYAEGELLVKFADDVKNTDKHAAKAAVKGKGIKYLDRFGIHHWKLEDGMTVEKALKELGKRKCDDVIEFAEPNWYVKADLLHEEIYVYAVRAINEVGMGEVSKAVKVETNGGGAIMSPDSLALWLVFCLVPVLLVAGAFSASEPFRYSLLILLLPLFSQLHRKEVLDNKTRFAILGIIMERPGIHYSALREESGLSNGGAAHHLDVLERENFIRAVSDGRKKRFYTVHAKVPDKLRMTPEEIREAVVDLVASRPGISQLQVIEELGVDRDTAGYHLCTLVGEDVLHARKKGRYTVYTVNGKR